MSVASNSDTSGSRARELVAEIANEHGFLGEDVYAKMDAATRRIVEEAMRKKDEIISPAVTTYEILPNAALLHSRGCIILTV
jgi:hypothetical protein